MTGVFMTTPLLNGFAGTVPVALEWRPLGFLASEEDITRQWQRERGLDFWLVHRAAVRRAER